MLSAIEDLDFAARVHSTTGSRHALLDLGGLVEELIGTLREKAAEREVDLEASRATADLTAAIDPEVAERLILRMCEAVISRAERGEVLRLGVDQENSHCRVSISRPETLAKASAEQLFGTTDDAMSEGFPLRLTRGLAHSAGAELRATATAIALVFPRA